MTTNHAFESILGHVQSSCLNFKIELSPFSAIIHLKKSFIKNQVGDTVVPRPRSDAQSNDCGDHVQTEKIEALEKENSFLKEKIVEVARETQGYQEIIEKLRIEIKQKEKDCEDAFKTCDTANEAVSKLNKVLHENRDRYKKEKDSILKEHRAEIKVWRKDHGEANTEIINLKKKIEDLNNKDAELEELKNANAGLEEKVISLLDTLYGCEECGRHGDFCECDNAVHEPYYPVEVEDDVVLVPDPDSPTDTTHPPSTPLISSILPPLPPPTSTTWTPPATPPCSSCGWENYGPCPGNVCFGCSPPLEIRPLDSSSPSTTPPGTPPPLRRKNQSMLGNMPAVFSKK